jgi:predicted PurR-regulated permease PerM
MSLPMGVQARYWGAAALLFLVSLWFMGSVMLPFLVGGAMAYFLDPVADRLERLGMNRVAATSLISVLALVAVVLLVLAVIPTLVKQTTALINTAPEMVARLVAFLTERFPDLLDETSTVRQTLSDLGKSIQTGGAAVLQGLLSSALGLISALIFVVVVPVVAFYLLLDWDHMVARIDMLLPRDHAPVIRVLASEIDRTLAAFVRGQLSVCLVLGAYYSIGMIAVGLQFGLLVGAAAGAITFIPYIGALFGGALALGLALFQFWGDWLSIGLVALVFGVGQFLEGNVLTPRMVGKSVGFHPVWLMFALSVFGAAFGFVGLLVAVPVAASIGVLTRFFMGQYQASALYVGVVGRIPEDEDQA